MTIWEQVGQEIEDFASGIREQPVSTPVDAAALRQEMTSRFGDFETPIPLSDLTRQMADLLRTEPLLASPPLQPGDAGEQVPPSRLKSAVV